MNDEPQSWGYNHPLTRIFHDQRSIFVVLGVWQLQRHSRTSSEAKKEVATKQREAKAIFQRSFGAIGKTAVFMESEFPVLH